MPLTSLVAAVPAARIVVTDISCPVPTSIQPFWWLIGNYCLSDSKILPSVKNIGSQFEFWQGDDPTELLTPIDESFIIDNLDLFRSVTPDVSNLAFDPYQDPGTSQWFVQVNFAVGWVPSALSYMAHCAAVEQVMRNQNLLLGEDWKWAPEEYHGAWLDKPFDAPLTAPILQWGYDNCDAQYIPDEAAAIALAAELSALCTAAFGNP